MKTESKKDTLMVLEEGVNSVRMGVTVNSKLFELMSDNIYSNVPNAIMRELISNAIDASVLLPKEEQKPILVHIPENLGQDLIVQDFGKGMSIDTVLEVFANYFSSTKENDEKQIGGFGLGSKTPFAYVEERGFRVETTSPDDGVRRTFIFKRVPDKFGNKFPNYQYMEHLDIVNSSVKGTKISFALKSEKDINDFIIACLQMKWSSYPIEYSGSSFENYLKEDKTYLQKVLSDLKSNSYVVYSQNHIFNKFDVNNLSLTNSKFTARNSHYQDDVLLLLGSVLYFHRNLDIKAKNLMLEMALQMGIENPAICLSNQNNGYITLNASRENVRDNQVNKERLAYMLQKALFDFTQKYAQFIMNSYQEEKEENIINLDKLLSYFRKKSEINYYIETINSVKIYLKDHVLTVDDEVKSFDLTIFDEMIEAIKDNLKSETDLFLNFFENKCFHLYNNQVVSAESVLNNFSSKVVFKNETFNKYDKNPNFRNFLVKQLSNQVNNLIFLIEDKDLLPFFKDNLIEEEVLKKHYDKLRKLELERQSKKELKSHNLKLKEKIGDISGAYLKSKADFVLPKEYIIENIEKPTETDKAILLIYHVIVGNFNDYQELPLFENAFDNELKDLKNMALSIHKLIDKPNVFNIKWDSTIKQKPSTIIKRFMKELTFVMLMENQRLRLNLEERRIREANNQIVKIKVPSKILLEQKVSKSILTECKKEIKSRLIFEIDSMIRASNQAVRKSIPAMAIKQHILGMKLSHETILDYFEDKYNISTQFINDMIAKYQESQRKTIENNLLFINNNGLEYYFKERNELNIYQEHFIPLLNILYNLKKLSESKKMEFKFEKRPDDIQWLETENSSTISKEKINEMCHEAVQKEIEHIVIDINKGIILLSKIAEYLNKKTIENQSQNNQ